MPLISCNSEPVLKSLDVHFTLADSSSGRRVDCVTPGEVVRDRFQQYGADGEGTLELFEQFGAEWAMQTASDKYDAGEINRRPDGSVLVLVT